MLVRMLKNHEIKVGPRSRRVFAQGREYTVDMGEGLQMINEGVAEYAGVGESPTFDAEQTRTLAAIADVSAAEAHAAQMVAPATDPAASDPDELDDAAAPVTAEDLAEHSLAELKEIAASMQIAIGKRTLADLITDIVAADAKRCAEETAAETAGETDASA